MQLTVLAVFCMTELWKDLSACRLSTRLRLSTVIALATTPAHCSVPCIATGRSTLPASVDLTRKVRTSTASRPLQHSSRYRAHTRGLTCMNPRSYVAEASV